MSKHDGPQGPLNPDELKALAELRRDYPPPSSWKGHTTTRKDIGHLLAFVSRLEAEVDRLQAEKGEAEKALAAERASRDAMVRVAMKAGQALAETSAELKTIDREGWKQALDAAQEMVVTELLEERDTLKAALVGWKAAAENCNRNSLAEISTLRAALARAEERETYLASVLRVADGGQYRADWDSAIRAVVAERDKQAKIAHDRGEALRRYGKHMSFCAGIAASGDACHCGLIDFLPKPSPTDAVKEK